MENGLTILSLKSENVRGIKVVDLHPRATGIVKLRGKNGMGKTSVLDSIELAFNGKDRNANSPVRRGADSASAAVEMTNLIVKRVFRGDGSTKALSVSKVVGDVVMEIKKPQEFIDGIIGSGIGFDPLEYAERLKPSEQVDGLLNLVKLPRDPREIDKARADLYGQRTLVNRDIKQAEALLEATERAPEGTPDEEVSMAEMLREFADAQVILASHAKLRKAAEDAQQEVGRVQEKREMDLSAARATVVRLEAELNSAKEEYNGLLRVVHQMVDQAYDTASQAAERANSLVDPDLTEIQARMQQVETVNKDVHVKQRREEKVAEVWRVKTKAQSLSDQIESLDLERTELLTSAKFPLPDLSIDEVGGQSCVTYHGIPLQDCSSSEKLRISLALSVALNPTVRVVLIREGSLLDDEAMAALEAFAVEKEVQIWVEEVSSTNDGEGFFIQDGTVLEER